MHRSKNKLRFRIITLLVTLMIFLSLYLLLLFLQTVPIMSMLCLYAIRAVGLLQPK